MHVNPKMLPRLDELESDLEGRKHAPRPRAGWVRSSALVADFASRAAMSPARAIDHDMVVTRDHSIGATAYLLPASASARRSSAVLKSPAERWPKPRRNTRSCSPNHEPGATRMSRSVRRP